VAPDKWPRVSPARSNSRSHNSRDCQSRRSSTAAAISCVCAQFSPVQSRLSGEATPHFTWGMLTPRHQLARPGKDASGNRSGCRPGYMSALAVGQIAAEIHPAAEPIVISKKGRVRCPLRRNRVPVCHHRHRPPTQRGLELDCRRDFESHRVDACIATTPNSTPTAVLYDNSATRT